MTATRFDIETTPVLSWRGRVLKAVRLLAFLADGDDVSSWPGVVRTVVRDEQTGRMIYVDESDGEGAAMLRQTLERDRESLDPGAFLEKWDVQGRHP